MTPSWDLFVIILFVVIGGMGMMLGRGKVLNVLIGSYVGYVAATEVGKVAFDMVSGYSSSGNISLFTVKAVLFFATIVVLNSKTELAGKNGDEGSTVLTLLYSVLAGSLITISLLSFMTTTEKFQVLSSSNLINQIDRFTTLWIVAPIIVLIFADFLKNKFVK